MQTIAPSCISKSTLGPFAKVDKANKEYILSDYFYSYCDIASRKTPETLSRRDSDHSNSPTTSENGTTQETSTTMKLRRFKYTFKTHMKIPKLGIMLVGLGGNNGTTFTAGILANKHNITWNTKHGIQKPNFYGSITQASVTKIGVQENEEVYVPLKDILPMVNPEDLIISGWDISKMNMADAMRRAEVLDYDLQQKLAPYMKDMVPLPGIYYKDFIASNQETRADNVLLGDDKQKHLEEIRKHIREFKDNNKLDKVVVLWTANTERNCEVTPGVHDTADNLLEAIKNSHPEVSPSTIYAVACVLEGVSFINGSPQNTLVDGVLELATKKKVFVVGDDFKSGQTKFKTAFTDFLVGAGIKPISIASYNHLGNNDGKNLSSQAQFRSKEISKSGCVEDMLRSNSVLYEKDEHIDHIVVIKYVPSAGDTKKAIDEYQSEIFMGGKHTMSIYNVCEDSLLAAPLILDLLLLTELFERITFKKEEITAEEGETEIVSTRKEAEDFTRFDTVLSILGYLCKAPKTRPEVPLVNNLNRQRNAIENILKVAAGIPIEDNLLLQYKEPHKY